MNYHVAALVKEGGGGEPPVRLDNRWGNEFLCVNGAYIRDGFLFRSNDPRRQLEAMLLYHKTLHEQVKSDIAKYKASLCEYANMWAAPFIWPSVDDWRYPFYCPNGRHTDDTSALEHLIRVRRGASVMVLGLEKQIKQYGSTSIDERVIRASVPKPVSVPVLTTTE